ncbi:hypothetical protein [Leucobacter denitrificans]|uniref:Uncharacterized protein n=1 Tax=Leucobacter denitrificans TaxID=683042 RepID=A0A7G9S380_9MICO|nr:hypothetical protein [Leucobacter denitrificans]QNN62305.1 hypothetical protein H9L06_08460 [Leucobacter denitrificans]
MERRNAHRIAGSLAGIALAIAPFALAGCAAETTLTDSDVNVISQLTAIAPKDSEIDGTVTDVECWQPSENMLDEEQFRVLCRVHYDQTDEKRYRDMICIGDVNANPVTEYCYRWAYYTDMPEFADKPGHSAA